MLCFFFSCKTKILYFMFAKRRITTTSYKLWFFFSKFLQLLSKSISLLDRFFINQKNPDRWSASASFRVTIVSAHRRARRFVAWPPCQPDQHSFTSKKIVFSLILFLCCPYVLWKMIIMLYFYFFHLSPRSRFLVNLFFVFHRPFYAS